LTSPHPSSRSDETTEDRLGARERVEPPRPTAGSLVLRWSWAIILLSAAVAVGVYIASNQLSPTYASTAKIAVSVTGGTDANDSSLGANNIASQDAQMVAGSQVLALAQRDIRQSIPSSSISGGVAGAENVIAVQATAGSAALSQARAQAVARAFITYTNRTAAQQIAAARQQSSAQLRPLDDQINALQNQVDALGTQITAKSTSLQQNLDTLIAQRTSAIVTIAESSGEGKSSVSLIDNATGGSKTSPKPTLYAAIGLIVALLVFTRLAVYLDPRRRRVA
jgi:uncharacterized protein involved in exopolysaccharide biosynthesis